MKALAAAAVAALVTTVLVTPAPGHHVGAPQPSQDDPYFHCLNDSTADENSTPWFNNNFNGSWDLSRSMLDRHIPQGLTTWENYYGAGRDLLVMTAYEQADGRARIQGIDPADGSKTHYVQIQDGTHAGGIAIVGQWAFIPGKDGKSLRRYSLSKIADIFANGGSSQALDGTYAGEVVGTGFVTQAGNTIYAGTFRDDRLGTMKTYGVRSNGDVYETSGPIEVPKKTQGLLVLPDYFVFSTSYGRDNRSNLYVVRRGYSSLATSYNNGNLRCVRMPSMSEGVTNSDGKVYVLFESGADCYRYNESECWSPAGSPDRVITKLHRIPRTTLTDDLPVYRG